MNETEANLWKNRANFYKNENVIYGQMLHEKDAKIDELKKLVADSQKQVADLQKQVADLQKQNEQPPKRKREDVNSKWKGELTHFENFRNINSSYYRKHTNSLEYDKLSHLTLKCYQCGRDTKGFICFNCLVPMCEISARGTNRLLLLKPGAEIELRPYITKYSPSIRMFVPFTYIAATLFQIDELVDLLMTV